MTRGNLFGSRFGTTISAEDFLVHEKLYDIPQKHLFLLNVGDDVNLVEDDARVEDVERRVVKGTSQHDVLQELQPVGMVDFALNAGVADWNGLVKVRSLMQELAIIGFMTWKIGII